jgi:hypothetical protein
VIAACMADLREQRGSARGGANAMSCATTAMADRETALESAIGYARGDDGTLAVSSFVLLSDAGGDPAAVADRDAVVSRPGPDIAAALPSR